MKTYYHSFTAILFTLIFMTHLQLEAQQNLRPLKQYLYPAPPVAASRPVEFHEFGNTRIDPYFWLNDRNNPEVMAYLNAENEYCNLVMKENEPLQEEIFNELKSRIKEEDMSVKIPNNGYYYFTRTLKGKQYPLYFRQKLSSSAEEELIFDVNAMAEGQSAFIFNDYEVSPDNNFAAYTYNTTGSFAEFTLKIRDLRSGKDLPDQLENVQSFTWAADSKTLFYTIGNESLRPYKVLRHIAGTLEKDTPVFEENDELLNVSVSKTLSNDYILIESASFTTSEVRMLKSDQPNGNFQVFIPREKDVMYGVEHHKDLGFYVYYKSPRSKNGMIYLAPFGKFSDPKQWKVIFPHDEKVKIENYEVFENHLIVQIRNNGLTGLRIYNLDGSKFHNVAFPEPVYVVSTYSNPEYSQKVLRYSYSSLNRPTTIYQIDMDTHEVQILKIQDIPSGFDPDKYVVERRFARASDGSEVPMAILYKKGLELNGSNPALLYGYGAYGYSTDAWFRTSILSLVDRGFVYAIAQVRGGSEMGEQWYEDGKLMKKKNSFTDFIACAQFLVDNKYSQPKKFGIMGGSAGGLLVAAALNLQPEFFGAVIADVPFVDVINTMLDKTLPLTTQEYEQWGNPNKNEDYFYILSYSPYDNIKPAHYPPILATAGLNDSQVRYHEPAKWVAKLRANNTGDNIILLKTNMESGHGGATGRYDALRELAFEWVFLLRALTAQP